MENNLYKKEIWDEGYKDFNFFTAGDADPVKQYILKNLPNNPGECFEVGCFPGRYLSVLGEKNWKLNGIDQTEYLGDMIKWLKLKNYDTGFFFNTEVEKMDLSTKYDLVYSCGFIEHFIKWEEIILTHIAIVKQGGTLIITTPNFRGFQGMLHKLVDRKNYDLHNVKSMKISRWAKLLEANGFEIIDKSHFGKFAFWYGHQSRSYYKRFILYRFLSVVPFLKKIIFFNSSLLSPFCGIAARKI